jgi:5-methylcytosine-specific restriction protein A
LRSHAGGTFQGFHESTGYTVLHASVNIRGNESEIPEVELSKALDLFNVVQQYISHWCEKRLPGLLRRLKGSVDALDDLEGCRSSYEHLPETEQLEIRKSRIGQGKFRTDLILYWDRTCAVTGVTETPILRASHIKPWCDSDNRERLDKYNGLLLTPNLDALFDAGRIAFDDDGRMLISKKLSSDDRLRLGVEERMELRRIEQGHKANLRFHRKRFGFE